MLWWFKIFCQLNGIKESTLDLKTDPFSSRGDQNKRSWITTKDTENGKYILMRLIDDLWKKDMKFMPEIVENRLQEDIMQKHLQDR